MRNFFRRVIPGSAHERGVIGAALGVMAFFLLIDQYTKAVVAGSFAKYESRPVIDGFFSLTYVVNKGAAWSMLEGKIWLLLLIALAVTIAAVVWLRRLTEGWAERYFAIALVLSGVAGNSIDRIWRGAVVDFFDVYVVWGDAAHHWPIFNVADCAICVGVGIYFLSSLLRPVPNPKAPSA